MEKNVTFVDGNKKKDKAELELPRLHFIVAMDWIDKLGKDAFCAWLKMLTWVDRRPSRLCDGHIPWTMKSVAEHLGVSKSKLYTKIIRPLWNFGLIDMIEYEESKNEGTKPINIIVYTSPMNKHETQIKPLEKIRDYDTEYYSISKEHAQKGGRPTKVDLQEIENELNEMFGEENTPEENGCSEGFKNETGENECLEGFKNETPGGFKTKTGGVLKLKPNNNTNNITILTNNSTNLLNNESKYVSNDPSAAPTQQEGKQEEVNPLDRFGQNFNLTKYAKKELNELIKMHGPILVDEAVKRAVKGEANTPVGYIKGTLENWQELGLKTPEEIEEHEIRYYEEKKARKKQKPVQALSARKEEKTMPSVLQMIQQQDEDFSDLVISDEKRAAYLERLRLMNEKFEERKGSEGRP